MSTVASKMSALYTREAVVAAEVQGQGERKVPYLGAGWAVANLVVNRAEEPAVEPADAIANAFAMVLLRHGRPATF